MRNYIIISLLFIFCSCQSEKNRLLGTWICEYATEIDLNQKELVKVPEIKDSIAIEVDENMDTTYFPARLVIDFLNNEKVNFLYYVFSAGNWTTKNDSIFITADSSIYSPDTLIYKGILDENRLYLETTERNRKLIYCFKKQEKAIAKKYSQTDLVGTFWSYKESDSILATYHLLDSNEMIINDWHGIHFGRWGYDYISGIGCLYTTSMHTLYSKVYYILDDYSNVEMFSQIYGYEKPSSSIGMLTQKDLLPIEKFEGIKSKLIGKWSTREFNTISRSFDDSINYKDLYLSIDFLEDSFILTYSGIKISTNEATMKKLKGSWNLSATGEYIALTYKVKGKRNHEYETNNIISLTSVYEDSLTIGLDYISFHRRDCRIKDKNIKMTRNNGL